MYRWNSLLAHLSIAVTIVLDELKVANWMYVWGLRRVCRLAARLSIRFYSRRWWICSEAVTSGTQPKFPFTRKKIYPFIRCSSYVVLWCYWDRHIYTGCPLSCHLIYWDLAVLSNSHLRLIKTKTRLGTADLINNAQLSSPKKSAIFMLNERQYQMAMADIKTVSISVVERHTLIMLQFSVSQSSILPLSRATAMRRPSSVAAHATAAVGVQSKNLALCKATNCLFAGGLSGCWAIGVPWSTSETSSVGGSFLFPIQSSS